MTHQLDAHPEEIAAIQSSGKATLWRPWEIQPRYEILGDRRWHWSKAVEGQTLRSDWARDDTPSRGMPFCNMLFAFGCPYSPGDLLELRERIFIGWASRSDDGALVFATGSIDPDTIAIDSTTGRVTRWVSHRVLVLGVEAKQPKYATDLEDLAAGLPPAFGYLKDALPARDNLPPDSWYWCLTVETTT